MSDWVNTPESSHISAIRYDEENQDCFVRFGDGDTYRYLSVPKKVWEEFMAHPSKGRFTNIVLRRQYRYEKV
jgi:hypothetical protein